MREPSCAFGGLYLFIYLFFSVWECRFVSAFVLCISVGRNQHQWCLLEHIFLFLSSSFGAPIMSSYACTITHMLASAWKREINQGSSKKNFPYLIWLFSRALIKTYGILNNEPHIVFYFLFSCFDFPRSALRPAAGIRTASIRRHCTP